MRCSAGERWDSASSAGWAAAAAEVGVEEYGLYAKGRRRGAAQRTVRGEVVMAREVRGRARAKRERMRGVDMVFISWQRNVVGVTEMCNPTAVRVEGTVQVRRGCSRW